MFAAQPIARRHGLTLIELIVVLGIMLLIAALAVAFLPRFQDGQNLSRGVDQLSEWLLTAKQRAKRDGLPTGVRLLFDPTTNLAEQAVYVQQPDPLNGGMCQSIASGTATFTGVDFVGGATAAGQADLGLVEAGDYLEVYGSGSVHQITGVTNATTLTLANTSVNLTVPTSNYRILRQSRRLPGEDILQLPPDVVIDLNVATALGNGSVNVPSRQVTGGGSTVTYYEVLFSPTGAVIGQGTASGKIILWLLNTAGDNSDPGSSALVAIQVRTGFIASHPVAVGSNPYQFTQDSRSSGM